MWPASTKLLVSLIDTMKWSGRVFSPRAGVQRLCSSILPLPPHRTPQHKPRAPSSLSSTPSKKPPTACSYNEQLRIAMEISAREQEEAELRRRREEAELQRIIRLSLMEKWEPSGGPAWGLREGEGGGRGSDQGHMGGKGSKGSFSFL